MSAGHPMFPLGTVLFPHQALPLHVFEPRYRAMIDHCLAGDPHFGVVLIERGSEVGGGDVRFDQGTLARIVHAASAPDGRYALLVVGVQRLRVLEWLADDPYPRARIERRADEEPPAGLGSRVVEVHQLVVEVLTLRGELGLPTRVPASEIADNPVAASYQLSALAPIGPLDAQRVLARDTAAARLDTLDALLRDEISALEAGLGG